MAREPPNRVASQWEKIMEDSNEWTGIQHRNGETARERKRTSELEEQGVGGDDGVDDQGQIFRVEERVVGTRRERVQSRAGVEDGPGRKAREKRGGDEVRENRRRQ